MQSLNRRRFLASTALGAATLDDCALTVLSTVVTRHEGRIILDAGSKTLTNDQARGITNAPGYGAILTQDGSAIDATLTIEPPPRSVMTGTAARVQR